MNSSFIVVQILVSIHSFTFISFAFLSAINIPILDPNILLTTHVVMDDSKINWSTPLILAICLMLLYELEENISFSPLVRLLEDAICKQHYAKIAPYGNGIDEAMCKTVGIQTELAFVRGWFSLFKTAPGKH